MIGIFFGLLTAVFFASGSILVRLGQRTRPDDDGIFMTVLVNVLVLGAAAAFVDPPEWDTAGIVALIIGGIIGTVLGRGFLLRSVRLIGPSRASSFVTGVPVVAAVGGWIFLNETITWLEALGGAITIAGFWWLAKARTSTIGGTGTKEVPLWYYAVAAGAPLFFGAAFVLRKYGLELYPNSYLGAFIGAASAFPIIVLIDAYRGKLRERVRSNFQGIPWWFVAGGVTTAAALLSQFTAFRYLPAWVVGIFAGTQGIWAMILSSIFLRGDDHIDRNAVGGVVLSAVGVIIISIQQGLGG